MRTVAKRDGDYYIINGTKNFITHGKTGQVAVVIVRTGEPGDSHGMSAFIVERGTPGFSAGKKENKLGMRASETAEMVFSDCRVHKSQMLGLEGDGFVQSLKVLDGGRISIAALSVGIAQGAFDAALGYSKERHQFNKPISSFQGISFKLADMATRIEASRLLTFRAAELKNLGKSVNKESAMAKLYASEVAVEVAKKQSRFLEAMATPRIFRPRNFIGMPNCAPLEREPRKSRNWLFPGHFCKNDLQCAIFAPLTREYADYQHQRERVHRQGPEALQEKV
jgi:alkylation response protein AidB-like acyl-CoA dehydrogenase